MLGCLCREADHPKIVWNWIWCTFQKSERSEPPNFTMSFSSLDFQAPDEKLFGNPKTCPKHLLRRYLDVYRAWSTYLKITHEKSFDALVDEAFQQFNRSAHRGNADGMFLGRFLWNLITGREHRKVSLITHSFYTFWGRVIRFAWDSCFFFRWGGDAGVSNWYWRLAIFSLWDLQMLEVLPRISIKSKSLREKSS